MSIELGIASYIFGKTSDFALSSFFESIGFKDRQDIRRLEKFVKEFKEYIVARHKDNPDFERIMNFWSQNHIFEKIFLSTFNPEMSYMDFKDSIEYVDYLNKSEIEFSDLLMEELYDELFQLITALSEDSKVTILAIQKPILDMQNKNQKIIKDKLDEILKKIDEKISKGREEDEKNFFNEILQQTNSTESLSLNIIGGFSGGFWNKYEVENFDNSRECIRKLIIDKKFENIQLNNCMDYLKDYNAILAILDTLDSNEEEFDRIEEMAINAKRHIKNFDKTLEKIHRCLRLYFDSDIQNAGVIESTTDFKNLLERMLNRGSLRTVGKKYQFFINRKDNIYFNVYLSNEEIDYVNKQDEELLFFAKCGGDYFDIESFNKHTKISIVAEMLLELVDKKNLSAKYYKIGNYLIGEG
ncbi:hypothetical protein A6J84_002365 [Streptococcus sp. FDAARGOS_256]|jgi:hypothetical protein|uniref:hypothetical protein n=1 Tax=Streptococcus sp. FDAARGOS_256 TaxID=1975706 RepID=UPI000BAE5A19|nr:hypothetical protein [Streptococcus sp. FDAARGOS_256]PNK71177.1 hypothetical protein A6J84_002365 [Streptococcus sp. FDAARGOS_256]